MYALIHTSEHSSWTANAPRADQLEQLFMLARCPPCPPSQSAPSPPRFVDQGIGAGTFMSGFIAGWILRNGPMPGSLGARPYAGPPCCIVQGTRWVGPTLRVTKTADVSGVTTRAAWLLEAVDANAVADVLDELSHRLIFGRASTPTYTGYDGFSRDFLPPTAADYVPSLHGSLDWWRSGEQAKNRTRNMTPSALRSLIDQVVPPPNENPDGPDAPVAPSFTDQLLRIGTGVLIVGAIGGGAYAIYRLSKSDDEVSSPHRGALPSWRTR